MTTYYRFQYCDGSLSMIIQDDREAMYECARVLSLNKSKYPVAIFIIKVKEA